VSVQVTFAPTVTVVETLDGNTNSAAAAQRKVTHAEFNDSLTLNATSNPPATKFAGFLLTLTAGAATVNLAALTGTNGATVDGTGLKVQVLRVKNLGANDLAISEGASNGYAIGGTRTIKPGGIETIYSPEGFADIAAADRNIDAAGTGTQTSEWTIVMG
jgi:hypothetical protein